MSAVVCGADAASSLMVSVPKRSLGAVGEKTALIEQLAPGARVAQLLDCEKSPVAVMLETVSGAVPLLVSVTILGAEVLPMRSGSKLTKLVRDGG